MEYSYIKNLHDELRGRDIPRAALESFERAFDIEYTHHSTAMEGNTLTLIETKAVIEDGIAIGGKRLREIWEVTNHSKAFDFAKKKLEENAPLDEGLVKDFHEILMENIMVGGVYRNCDVAITGASHTPPSPNEMYMQMKYFFEEMGSRELCPIEAAAWIHAEFVRIHPFIDGNGRTARLIMNYSLMRDGFLPVNILTDYRLRYYECLDKYASERILEPFAELIAELETERLKKYLAIEFQ